MVRDAEMGHFRPVLRADVTLPRSPIDISARKNGTELSFLLLTNKFNKEDKLVRKVFSNTGYLIKDQQNNNFKALNYKNFISKLFFRFLIDKTNFSIVNNDSKELLSRNELINILDPFACNQEIIKNQPSTHIKVRNLEI